MTNKVIIIVFACIFLAGCKTTHPIYNANATIPTSIATDEMKKAVINALQYKRWRVLSQTDNKIVAGINVRSHYAEIVISFENNNYQITYQNSYNLDYNAETQGIHRNYNKWIKILSSEIERNIYNR